MKGLESIQRDVIPFLIVGVLAKNERWLKHTLEDILQSLEAKALRLGEENKKRLEKEHLVRKQVQSSDINLNNKPRYMKCKENIPL